ncbi:MAG: methyltransferase domain-containing protein [Acidimicrobiia bacterium]|jgi:tRNA (mo5U34)-methyltransferase|nr:methyltransferase domain-containing protein [Acidimicrobiia bacterium]
MDRTAPGDGAGGGVRGVAPGAVDVDALRRRIDDHGFWYHTIDVVPGVTTPGWFDLRNAVGDLPWPDVAGRRCLDIGTFDGFYAFELERRGAAEVVAIDVEDHLLWDWPPDYRGKQLSRDPAFGGPPKGAGFRLLVEATGSIAQWRPLSIYDLDPAVVGTFDVVILGSLLLHLRDPVRALEAVRSVVASDGWFLSIDQIEAWLTLRGPHTPLFTLNGSGADCQWFTANAAGHHRLVFSAGFEVVEKSSPFVVAFDQHPRPGLNPRELARRAAFRALTGSWTDGVLHRGLLARRRVDG